VLICVDGVICTMNEGDKVALSNISRADNDAQARAELLKVVRKMLTNGKKHDRLLAESAAVALHRRQNPKTIARQMRSGNLPPVRKTYNRRSGLKRIDKKTFGLVDETKSKSRAGQIANKLRSVKSLPNGRRVQTFARVIPRAEADGRLRYSVYAHAREVHNPNISATNQVRHRYRRNRQ